ncbi:MAG: biotin--[acetyl-CoA-carboxylase] ligase [Deltaproteobacteria bacterium]
MGNTESRIIGLLKSSDGAYTSGQAISRTLGISRNAVWKHVESLRKSGYSIKAFPRKGYVLISSANNNGGPFNKVELGMALSSSKLIGKTFVFFDSTDSTNLRALTLAKNGAAEGTVVIADSQSEGRGRLGRKWVSPRGVNLYTSVIFRPNIPPHRAHAITLVSAVAVAETIGAFCRKKAEVKWPNDVLLDSKKVAGILTEMSSETDRVNFMVVGIGINANMALKDAPFEIKSVATSIAEKTSMPVDRVKLVTALYSNLEKWYKIFIKSGLPPVLKAWKDYFMKEGKPITVKGLTKTIKGICLGVDEEGALLLRLPSGEVERVVSGDVE